MVSVADRSYIAGIIDGEGSIIISSEETSLNRCGRKYTVVVQIANTNLDSETIWYTALEI